MSNDPWSEAVEVTTTYLEMRAPTQHKRTATDRNLILAVEGNELELRRTYYRVSAGQLWRSVGWTEAEWSGWVTNPEALVRLIQVDGETAGIAELKVERSGDVEIVTFGLVPEFVGRGLGAPAPTLVVDWAWSLARDEENESPRVWLHTCTQDHPRALPNYLAAGYEVFRTETDTRNAYQKLPPAPSWVH